MKTKHKHYKIGQVPPRHWYQKKVGWPGKTLVLMMVVTVALGGMYGQIMNSRTIKSYAAQTNAPEKLEKVTGSASSNVENIIDVQHVLDVWQEKHSGEKWSVSARSISGPSFEAHMQQDTAVNSDSLGHLLMTLPLFDQIPAEQQKSIRLESGKTMAACVNLMIRLADKNCGYEIAEYLDFRKANDSLKKAGLSNTSLSLRDNKTTAADVTTFLRVLSGSAMTENAKESVITALKEQTKRDGIALACPGCNTANAAGEGSPTYDVAIVDYNGGTYAISIITSANSAAVSELAGKIQQKIIDTLAD